MLLCRIFMDVIKISFENMPGAVGAAAEVIKRGGIVAFPTETYYGLGAAYDSTASLKKLFALKHRPEEKPMPLIAGNLKAIGLVAQPIDRVTASVIEKFWPGPLTLLLPAREGLPRLLTAGTANVAVRIPGESFALALAHSLAYPITATSANISGMRPADTAEEVLRYFGGGLDLVIDGGRTPGGAPSTIVTISEGTLTPVRQGRIPFTAIFDAVKEARGRDDQ
jgi:L-threonylcarbamoyladenylate synthase